MFFRFVLKECISQFFHIVHTSESAWVSYTITNPFQNVFFLLVLRYLVATGFFGWLQSSGVTPEIVDLSDPTKSCVLEDIPFYKNPWNPAGGLMVTTPVICGGFQVDYKNECLLYGTSEVITMNSKRHYASSVTLNANKLWILGGYDGNNNGILASTEFITIDGAENGPTLPEGLWKSCAIKFPETGYVYLIGGKSNNGRTNNVWVANPSNEYAFTQGPSLMTVRSYHSCGTMFIGTKSIIVAAGGDNGGVNKMASVEILDPLSNQWVAGK